MFIALSPSKKKQELDLWQAAELEHGVSLRCRVFAAGRRAPRAGWRRCRQQNTTSINNIFKNIPLPLAPDPMGGCGSGFVQNNASDTLDIARFRWLSDAPDVTDCRLTLYMDGSAPAAEAYALYFAVAACPFAPKVVTDCLGLLHVAEGGTAAATAARRTLAGI